MTAPDFWLAVLKCGCEARFRCEIRPGEWISCTSLKHQAQQRVMRVSPGWAVPGPGEAGVQGELWERAA